MNLIWLEDQMVIWKRESKNNSQCFNPQINGKSMFNPKQFIVIQIK